MYYLHSIATTHSIYRFVDFSLNRVRMLIHFGVTPYLVFDGDYLPSKASTEAERATRRAESRRVGLELYRHGKPSLAHKELQKAVDVTPEMASQLIVELKKLGVQYVVAPYEADAQLAYLERRGLIQGILSEDSDLLVFGANCLLTKLNQYGDCIEINRNDFTACRDISLVGWSDAEFRLMAILSGCDYLPSINNMGLLTAYRFVRKYKTIEKILRMLEFDGKYHVPTGYLEAFHRAESTFLYQRVFCPLLRDLSMASDTGAKPATDDMAFIGARVEKEIAIKVASGVLHPVTKKPLKIPGQGVPCPTPPNSVLNRDAIKFTDMKENRSIETFFRAKRTPLAELDPNSFTPSPSQRRLQQRVCGTWMSSPAPAGPSTREFSVSTPIVDSRDSTMNSNRQAAVSAPHPQSKRRRLCSDIADDQDSSVLSVTRQDGRSRFFSHANNKPTPTIIKTRRKKAAAVDVNIWSDDSVEDVMAGLPDIVHDGDVAAQPNKLPIFQDNHEIQTASASTNSITQDEDEICLPVATHEESRAHDSQSSISSRATNVSEMSISTNATSIATSNQTGSQTMDEYVIAELKLLRQQYSSEQKLHSTASQRNPSHYRIKPGDYQRAIQALGKPQSMRQGILTPLQRIGASALNRSQSWSGSTETTSQHVVKPLIDSTIDDTTGREVTSQSTTPGQVPFAEPEQPMTIVPELSTVKGSEDLIIPDSEEEASDATSCSDVEKPRQPNTDLGRFAFSG